MLQTLKKFTQTISLGAVASAFIHVIILILLVFGLPQLKLESEELEIIQVELVLPEEEEPQEQQQSEPGETAEAEPEETAEAEPEETAESEPEETAEAEQADVQPPEIFRPVYQFGEEDSGPRESADGDAESEPESVAEPATEEPIQSPDAPEQIVSTAEAPTRESITAPKTAEEPLKLAETTVAARSPHNTESAVATTAMGDLPRGIRAGDLCVTELRLQLNGSVPPYWPDLLPTYRLDEGTILQVRRGAFRSKARWYNLKFRCEIDEAATRVVSFEFDVGTPVPRAEWRSRGLPAS